MTMEGLRKENDDMPAKETRQESGWAKLLEELRQDRNESYREASLAALPLASSCSIGVVISGLS